MALSHAGRVGSGRSHSHRHAWKTRRRAARFCACSGDRRCARDAPEVDLADRRKTLLALPGIGPWTVEYVAMRAWRDADAWPASDLVLMQAITGRDPALLKLAHQRARAEAWRPWRAYVAMHLWNEIADRTGNNRGG